MRRILLPLLCCLTVVFVSAQNTSQNYLHTRKMLNSTATGYVDHISYHDGLGRPFQTVQPVNVSFPNKEKEAHGWERISTE